MVRTRSQWRAAASASRLSPELLRMTFAWFCPHCRHDMVEWQNWADPDMDERNRQDFRSLFDLCQVSLAFSNAAQQVLYHSVDTHYLPATRSRPRLEQFLRTIAARPDLAHSVKSVSLDSVSPESLDFFTSRDAFYRCARALGINAPDIWHQAEHAYQSNPMTQHQGYKAFFFVNADPGSWAQYPSMPFLASQLLTMLVALLPNLSYFKVDTNLTELDLSRETSNAIGLTRLPLKTLDTKTPFKFLLELSPDIGTLVCRSGRSFESLPNVQSLPSVQSLVVDSLSMDRLTIQSVVSACIGHLSNFTFRGASVTLGDIVQALSTEKLCASLESIHIDCRQQVHTLHTRNRTTPSFRSFLNLRTLFLSISLLGSDTGLDNQALVGILPDNITSLTLVGNEQGSPSVRFRDRLVGLAEAKANASVLKNLSWVRCDVFEACDQYVKDLFEQVGVDFSYQKFPRSHGGLELDLLNEFAFMYEPALPFPMPLPQSDDDDDL
ncbi:unnamed protein product [Clonostachys rosea]|uniref:F-box domain-containing protein n=1 Tax=Bionectria ochroleuca TaxID=29856 RepID=A0ABY6UDK4_BIOOC|nr:unnamed protein product [Clonostachys rosea]